MSKRSDEFQKNLDKLKQGKEARKRIVKTKKGTIKRLSESVRRDEQVVKRDEFTEKLYNCYSTEFIDQLPDQKYRSLIIPLRNIAESECQLVDIVDDVEQNHSKLFANESFVSSMSATTSLSASGSIMAFYEMGVKYKPAEAVIARHEKEIRVESEIDYIKQELPKYSPEIARDFDAFLKAWYSSEDEESRWQFLLGPRTFFFWKLVSPKGEPFKREYLDQFVYGSNVNRSPEVENLLDEMLEFWNQLSNNKTSVKRGNVKSPYVRGAFKKMIISIAELLRVRAEYFVR